MDKLIEEISDQLSTYLLEDTDTEQLFEIPNEEYWAFLKSLITRIGKAYAGGELELPDEEQRFHGVTNCSQSAELGKAWLSNLMANGICKFIALRKEEEG